MFGPTGVVIYLSGIGFTPSRVKDDDSSASRRYSKYSMAFFILEFKFIRLEMILEERNDGFKRQ